MGGDRASDGLPGAAAAAYALMPGRRCTASAHPSMNERDSQCPPRLRAVPMFDASRDVRVWTDLCSARKRSLTDWLRGTVRSLETTRNATPRHAARYCSHRRRRWISTNSCCRSISDLVSWVFTTRQPILQLVSSSVGKFTVYVRGYSWEVGALFTTVSSIRVVGLALWLVSGIALNKYRCE